MDLQVEVEVEQLVVEEVINQDLLYPLVSQSQLVQEVKCQMLHQIHKMKVLIHSKLINKAFKMIKLNQNWHPL